MAAVTSSYNITLGVCQTRCSWRTVMELVINMSHVLSGHSSVSQDQVVKLKPEKNSGLNGIRTHDLCDTGAVLYRLSYQAIWELVTLWVRNIPVEIYEIYEISYIWTLILQLCVTSMINHKFISFSAVHVLLVYIVIQTHEFVIFSLVVNDHYAMSRIDSLLSANAKIAFQVIACSICGSHYLAIRLWSIESWV